MDEAEEAILRAIEAEAAVDNLDEEEEEEEVENNGNQVVEKSSGSTSTTTATTAKTTTISPALPKPNFQATAVVPGNTAFDAEQYQQVNGKKVYTAPDGTMYEWDEKTKAYFPMWQENLVESQQSIYDSAWSGNTSTVPDKKNKRSKKNKESKTYGVPVTSVAAAQATPESASAASSSTEKQEGPVKVQPKTVIYVSGLPVEDNTVEEMNEFFSKKCGVIKIDLETGQPKIKLYRTEEGNLKGDAYISFLKPESVELAIALLDGTEYRAGHIISVTQAEFTEKGNAKKKQINKRKAKQRLQQLEKKLEWFDEGLVASKFSKIVILKHMFQPEKIEKDPGLIIDLKMDIREECEKLGDVVSVIVYDKHPEGVCAVKFKDQDSAEACVELLDGRYFAGQVIQAALHNGQDKFDQFSSAAQETAEEEEARLKRYGDWLEKEEAKAAAAAASSSSSSSSASAASAASSSAAAHATTPPSSSRQKRKHNGELEEEDDALDED